MTDIAHRDAMAFDRASVRFYDDNGNLHVETSPLTRVQVAPYYGSEIPHWREMGLEPTRIYRGYRPPEELSKPETIRSLIGIPIQLDHHPDYPTAPAKETRVGSTGDLAKWEPPYLMNSLHITDKVAIDHILDNSMRELSLSYRYKPDFSPGETPGGEPYDFVMREISANHVALVEEGRAGSTVLVMDNALKESAMDDEKKDAAIESAEVDLAEKVKENAQALIDLHEPAPDGGLVDKAADEDPKQALIAALVEKGMTAEEAEAFLGKAAALTAQDEEPEDEKQPDEQQPDEQPAVDETQEAIDEGMKECGFDEAPADIQKAFAEGMKYALKKGEAEEPAQDEGCEASDEAECEKEAADEECAADSAKKIAAMVEKRLNEKYSAIDFCRATLGNVKGTAFDSADAVYIAALKQEGVDVSGMQPSAARAAYVAYLQGKKKVSTMAQDSKPKSESPIGSILKKIGNGL